MIVRRSDDVQHVLTADEISNGRFSIAWSGAMPADVLGYDYAVVSLADGKNYTVVWDLVTSYDGLAITISQIYLGAGYEPRAGDTAIISVMYQAEAEGSTDETLDQVDVADFQAYFKRDFNYLPVYSATKTYFANDIVFYSENFYTCLVDGTVGITPGTDPTKWSAANLSQDSYIVDDDIEKAFAQAREYTNPEIFDTSRALIDAYLFCTAHYMVMDIRAAEGGLDSRGSAIAQSRSVGSVSESLAIPDAFTKDPQWAYFAQTAYGQKFLSYVIPRVTGRVGVASGATQA